MNTQIEFQGFNKIPRWSREIIVTEKIDGTNACIYIGEDGTFLTGSRKRWITPEDDNYGFAKWANEHKEELMQLGVGRHFGEWWGAGIQRGYGLQKDDKRFSLFNVTRWCLAGKQPKIWKYENDRQAVMQQELPLCVGLVPVIWTGNMDDFCWPKLMIDLSTCGSQASPGYGKPEGIVIYHVAGNVMFKKTFEKDATGKEQG